MNKKWYANNNSAQIFSLVVSLVLLLSSCAAPAQPAPTAASAPTSAPAATATSAPTPTSAPTAIPATATAVPSPTIPAPPQFDLTLSAGEVKAPEKIHAGLVRLVSINTDKDWHASIVRRLNDDVKLADFQGAFKKDPHTTLPLTSFLGGPDVPAGKSVAGYYNLKPGTYVLVDNWNEPWHFTSFEVTGTAGSFVTPAFDVAVSMQEYVIELPKTVPSGKHLWQFTNNGKALHNIAIIQLKTGKTIKDVIQFIKDGKGEPPSDYLAAWNMLTPGITSWGEVDLKPGDYLILDLIPDFAGGGDMLNVEKNMYTAFSVTP